ncbi:hypothetical protein INR49_022005 [Caranx melampygus]|nr:hypothetical protein INR49_022005 [Caranx melampygus]
MFKPRALRIRASMLGGRGRGCLSQSSTESGSGMPLVSGSSRHRPQPMIGPLLYTSMAANEIAPFGLGGTRAGLVLPWYLDSSNDRKQAAPLRNRASMLIGRRPRRTSGTSRHGASDRPEKNWAE